LPINLIKKYKSLIFFLKKFLPLFIFLIAFFIRFYGLIAKTDQDNNPWIHFDEPTYIASGIWYINFGHWSFNWEHPPLSKLIIGGILWLVGIRSTPWIPPPWPVESIPPYGLPPELPLPPLNALYFARLPNVIIGSLNVLLVYYIAEKEIGEKINALLTGLFLAFYPVHIHYSRTATLDVPLTFFTTITLWFMYKMLVFKDKRHFLVVSVFYGLALATKFPAIMILPISIAGLMILPERKKDKIKLVGLATIFAFGIFFIIWPYLWSNPLGNIVKSLSYHMKYHIGNNRNPFFEINNTLPNFWWTYFIFLATPASMLVFVFSGFFSSIRNLKKKNVSFILVWFLIPYVFMTLFIAHPWNNYFVWLTPSISLIAGLGSTLLNQNKKSYLLIIATVMITALLVILRYPSYEWPIPF
jgi:predicted membrane-bound dolichyl-phosphate-mannose-protein mannosyltransferase